MRFLRDNGLTIVLLLAFLASISGMALTGFQFENEVLAEHAKPSINLAEYLLSGSFASAVFENWESEFLQMAAYVILTAYLFQRGSSESKDPDKDEPVDESAAGGKRNQGAPWPVRAGGIWSTLYSYSLGIALGVLFLLSFLLHWFNSAAAAAEEAALHDQPQAALTEYLFSAQLWFESFQNWQSEFLSTAVIVVLSIVLRYRGSPESKPVAAPHAETGGG
jgi:membrane protein implicated in regulation of membrane protease activity